MERKRSIKQGKKPQRRSSSPRKVVCSGCPCSSTLAVSVQHSLYMKYAFVQNHYYLLQFNSVTDKLSQSTSTAESQEEEYLARYHKTGSRKQMMLSLKDVYSMQRQIPRIFLSQVRDILVKCHHRKRLVQYFKIAKTLGIKVESVNFSSFLLSLSLPGTPPSTPFPRLLADMSASREYGIITLREMGVGS